jgi:ubiquinone/menaquinone biosynthesis C-methylase UbiE
MSDRPPTSTHDATIVDQFSRQAAAFAQSAALQNEEALDLLVSTGNPLPTNATLDVACGPGSIAIAFAKRVRHATGLDATEAMLQEARRKAAQEQVRNVAWSRGSVYALPFPDGAFDIVSCRFAFHHLERPAQAFAEMIRVCASRGRIVLCDAVCSDDPRKAAAFNRMERFRDPSTVEFRSLGFLRALYLDETRQSASSTSGSGGIKLPTRKLERRKPIWRRGWQRGALPSARDALRARRWRSPSLRQGAGRRWPIWSPTSMPARR